MADDIPQDTTTVQDMPTTDQSVVQPEPPKVEEQPTETPPTETPSDEKPTVTEEAKPEPVSETPGQPKEETKQEEQKPVEETKPDEKPAEIKIEKPKPEEKPEKVKIDEPVKEETPKPPEIPQQPETIKLDEQRAKANKERQDRKQEHLSEVEKLAKSKQINNDDVRELLHVSQSTATNYLEELVKQGKIKKSGKAKATSYSS